MQKLKKGTMVYIHRGWNAAEKCVVVNYTENEFGTKKNVYTLLSLFDGGIIHIDEKNVFTTVKEAIEDAERKSAKLVEQYKSKIKTLKDLVKFPLKHCIAGGEEYIDWDARKAYEERLDEIFTKITK